MGTVAAIGAPGRVSGFRLAGVLVLPVDDDAAARAAWQDLPSDVAVVILTAQAARAIEPGPVPLTVVLP